MSHGHGYHFPRQVVAICNDGGAKPRRRQPRHQRQHQQQQGAVRRRRQRQAVRRLLETGRQIPLAKLLSMSEYPADRRIMLSLYAQGVSLVSFLVERGGRARFLAFLDDAGHRDWDVAVRSHYGGISIEALEREWMAWVVRPLVPPKWKVLRELRRA